MRYVSCVIVRSIGGLMFYTKSRRSNAWEKRASDFLRCIRNTTRVIYSYRIAYKIDLSNLLNEVTVYPQPLSACFQHKTLVECFTK